MFGVSSPVFNNCLYLGRHAIDQSLAVGLSISHTQTNLIISQKCFVDVGCFPAILSFKIFHKFSIKFEIRAVFRPWEDFHFFIFKVWRHHFCFVARGAIVHKSLAFVNIHIRRVASGGAGRQCPPDFRFCPPDLFLFPHGDFLGRRSCFLWPEKTLKLLISAQKKLSDFGDNLFFWEITCFWPENLRFRPEKALGFRQRLFFFEITCFWPKNLRFRPEKASGFRRRPFFFFLEITRFWPENLRFRPEKAFGNRRKPFFFGDHLVLAGKNVEIGDFCQKKPSETGENLCPSDFNFAPPISRSWRCPWFICCFNLSFNKSRYFFPFIVVPGVKQHYPAMPLLDMAPQII